jgi:hypothetical protein
MDVVCVIICHLGSEYLTVFHPTVSKLCATRKMTHPLSENLIERLQRGETISPMDVRSERYLPSPSRRARIGQL